MVFDSMRKRALIFLCSVLSACGGDGDSAGEQTTADTQRAEFLDHLPAQSPITVRLPAPGSLEGRQTQFLALLRALGHKDAGLAGTLYDLDSVAGLDPARPAGLAQTPTGTWVRYLPAGKKRLLAEAFRDRVARGMNYREEGSLVILSRGAQGASGEIGEALPPGDFALRVRFHPLLSTVASATDTLELGFTLDPEGLRFEGRLLPGAQSPTADALKGARPSRGGLIELLPASLALRVETTLPATILASLVARRLSVHAGIRAETDRDTLVRFLREALTAVDPERGIAFGIRASEGQASFVATGKIGPGAPSRVLNRMREGGTHEFGALILDSEQADKMPRGMFGFYAWVADAQPNTAGLPESFWGWAHGLANRAEGFPLTYSEHDGYFVVSGGPQADQLAVSVRKRLRSGGRRARSAWMLHEMRQGRDGYVLGAILSGARLEGMAAADRAGLRRTFGAGKDATAPRVVVLTGLKADDGTLHLHGRVIY